ncbi:SHOCT domain-containing protein [Levilactobacillus tujiorum]|uniref:SHOCT domain-containing protein n=1 Tax=Levilactobacillus tujiorum TaxID=2912243 RepID=UPI0038CC03A1
MGSDSLKLIGASIFALIGFNLPDKYALWTLGIGAILVIWFAFGKYSASGQPNAEKDNIDTADSNNAEDLEKLKKVDLNSWAVQPSGYLPKNNEFEFSRTDNIQWIEPVTRTKNVLYGGVTSRVRLMKGVYWRMGSVKPLRQTTTELKVKHIGTLIFTNKRMLLLQDSGSVSQVMYGSIANIVPYTDGIGVMKSRGKDVYLTSDTFEGEKAAIVLTRLITGDLDSPTLTNNSHYQSDKMPLKELLQKMGKDPQMSTRLDTVNNFFDLHPHSEYGDLSLETLWKSYQDNPGKTRVDAGEFLNNIVSVAQTVEESTYDEGYSIRGFIGTNDFETLFAQIRHGVVEYYLLDDPKFLESFNLDESPEYDTKEERDTTASGSTSVTDEIRKFKGLLDDGIITQEEFDAKKKQLLGI